MALDQLMAMRIFVRVVDTGTFTRASESLAVPKATVTKLIQGLEAHLHTKLLNRTTRRVLVTPDGALYYERALRFLTDLDELDGSMAQSQALPAGRLRVEMSGAMAKGIVVPSLWEFHGRYPDIRVDLGVSDRQIDILAENVDCAIRIGTIADQSLVARRISTMAVVTCASPVYLEKFGEPQHPDELPFAHYCISYFNAESPRQYPMQFNRDGETLRPAVRYALGVNEGMTYVAAVLAGLGIAQVPAFMVHEAFRDGRLKPVLSEWTQDAIPVYVVYPPNRHVSNKLRVFVDWVADLFARSRLDL